jgi:transcriptional regulator with XRE-family HTH domain
MNIKTDKEIVAEIAVKIQNFRLNDPAHQMSQAELARRAGISRSTVARFEQKGEISLLSLIAILRVLGLLSNFDQLVPKEIAISPMQISRMQAKKTRQRVRK